MMLTDQLAMFFSRILSSHLTWKAATRNKNYENETVELDSC